MRKTVAVCCATAWLPFAMQAHALARDIDALSLPPAGLERAYACRSNLNAISAMMLEEKEGTTLLRMYLIMNEEVISRAKAEGVAEAAYKKRMAAWDAAVVVAILEHTDAVGKNILPCMKMAAEIYSARAGK